MGKVKRRRSDLFYKAFVLIFIFFIKNSCHFNLEIYFILLRIRIRTRLLLIILIILLILWKMFFDLSLSSYKFGTFLIQEIPNRYNDLIWKFIEEEGCEMKSFVLSTPSESRSLNCEYVLGVYYSADGSSRSGFFIFGESKSAARHIKKMRLILHQQRKNTASISIMLTSIAKDIVLFTMTVKIKAKIYSWFLGKTYYLLLNVKNLRVQLARRLFPSAIQIYSCHVASEITVNYSVHIHHRIELNQVIFKHILNLWTILQQSSHKTPSNVRRPYFSWMLPC